MSDSQFHNASSSDVYRIYAHDQPRVLAGQKVALRVAHSPQEEVWYGFRQLWVDTMNGAEIHIWNPWIPTYGGTNPAHTIRLDPRPATLTASASDADGDRTRVLYLVIGQVTHAPTHRRRSGDRHSACCC